MWSELTLALEEHAADSLNSVEDIFFQHWGIEDIKAEDDQCKYEGCEKHLCRRKHTQVLTWPRTLVVNLKRFKV